MWCARQPGAPDLLIRSLKPSMPILPTWRWRCRTGSHSQPHKLIHGRAMRLEGPPRCPPTSHSLSNLYQEDRFHLQGQRPLGSFFPKAQSSSWQSFCSRASRWMGLFLHLAGKTQLFARQRFSFLSLSEQARMVWTQ